MLVERGHEVLRHLREPPWVALAAPLHVDLEAAGLPQPLDAGRVESEGQPVLQREAHAADLLRELLRGLLALLPAFHWDEDGRRIALGAPADQVEAVDDEEVADGWVLRVHQPQLLEGGALGARQRGAVGQHHRGDDVALVFLRHEAAGHTGEQPSRPTQHQRKAQQGQHAAQRRIQIAPSSGCAQSLERAERRSKAAAGCRRRSAA